MQGTRRLCALRALVIPSCPLQKRIMIKEERGGECDTTMQLIKNSLKIEIFIHTSHVSKYELCTYR